ncbi:MAG: hypothetical protein ABIQ31_18100 [Ferruginibacter sp.]
MLKSKTIDSFLSAGTLILFASVKQAAYKMSVYGLDDFPLVLYYPPGWRYSK